MDKNKHYIVNIGRQYGSGGRVIGTEIAGKLGFSFYDKELINLASKESGVGAEFFEKADEKTRFGFFGNFFGLQGGMASDEFTNNYLNNENLFLIQSDVIRQIAEERSAVFVGRCADYILREHPYRADIFITADMNDRIERLCNRRTIERNKAVEMIEKIDKKRAEYYNYYTNKTWGVAKSYHLCINSSTLGIQGSVEFAVEFVRQKLEIKN
ncbi:MAG: cytidylate kinase-like family protein [Bacteroidales bacterium]|nr:cytidylate kinase-like family protein [Bacteroidales bacterium]